MTHTLPAVLVIDDNAANRKLLSVVLTKSGFRVATAVDADEAIARISESKPDLILMDIQLPGTDGLELTKYLRARVDTRDVIIVAVTSYALKGDRERANAAGCNGYLTKPLDTRTLASTLSSYLDRH